MKHSRPPIIAVVGHIDHGKSKLQQAIRKSNANMVEAGDITQHIGAYELKAMYEGKERSATIIDTPGHEAFSHIRGHGLDIADVAILVISSEEGWKEQTKEAYELIQKLKIPFIISFTKIDTEKSNIEKAKQTVLENGVFLEGIGGDVPFVAVSSITNQGVDDLINLIFLTTDVYEIIEDRKDGSVGILVEADIDPKSGIAGTIIVLEGVLENKDYIRIGTGISPLRIMKNDGGDTITSAKPSMPIRVIGFSSIPPIGESVFLYETKKKALEDVKKENVVLRNEDKRNSKDKTISLILKSDTASGLVSIEQALKNVAVEGIFFNIIKKDVGEIVEEDVRIISREENGHVVGFHTTANQQARKLSERSDVDINLFPTIYEIIDWAKHMSKEKKEKYEIENPTGEATILRIFEENEKNGVHIVGAQISDGIFSVGQNIAVLKNGKKENSRFKIESIEQRNKKADEVSGEKTQFAMRVVGDGAISMKDSVVALPDVK